MTWATQTTHAVCRECGWERSGKYGNVAAAATRHANRHGHGVNLSRLQSRTVTPGQVLPGQLDLTETQATIL